MELDSLLLLKEIARTLFDKKGENIMAIDVREFSTLTDFCIIADGLVERHVEALARAVMDLCDERGLKPIHVEGLMVGDWIVIDYLDVVIHLLTPKLRERYRLEELWKEGKIVDLDLKSALGGFSG